MSKKDKLFKKFSQKPWKSDATFDELSQLLNSNGFEEQETNGGSHHKFKHKSLDYSIILPRQKPMKAAYVKMVIEAICAIK